MQTGYTERQLQETIGFFREVIVNPKLEVNRPLSLNQRSKSDSRSM
jgi:hypothetical protein